MNKFTFRRLLKRVLFGMALVAVSPLILVAWLERKFSRSEAFFVGSGQFLALFPGLIGSFSRSAYYYATLEKCSWEVHIGFGSYFSHRSASLGTNTSMGSFCVIGNAAIGDEVMIGSRVSIPSGKRQHIDDSGQLTHVTRLDRVTVGNKTWIGEGAIILDDVGTQCIVSAGTVVTKKTADGQLIAGNPGKVIRVLNATTPKLSPGCLGYDLADLKLFN